MSVKDAETIKASEYNSKMERYNSSLSSDDLSSDQEGGK